MAKEKLVLLFFATGFILCYGFDHLAPRIIEQPSDMVVARHQPATLQCRAEGTPPPIIRWFKDGVSLVGGGRRDILPSGGLFFLRTAHARRDSDAGMYWCEATNRYGTARSRNASLQVAVLREDFRLEPADTRAAAGDTALLECAPPRGTPEPLVSWKKNGQLLDLEENLRVSIVDGGNLVIQDLRQTDDGRYQCIAKNIVGTRESSIAHLRVLVKPYLIAGPDDAIALTGNSVTFQCRVGGDPLPDVLWRRSAGGGNMPLGRVHILEDRSLRLDSIVLEDEGEYSCEADNSVGAITASGILKVHSPPFLEVRPMAQSVEVGMEAFYECSASGSPKPTLFWSLEGNHSLIFPGVSWSRYTSSMTVEGKSKLVLHGAQKDDSGATIVCSALNVAGAVTGRAKLMVTSEDDRPPPVIVLGPSNQTLPIKSIADFPCSAIGSPEPVVSWYHKSIPVLPSPKINISDSGSLTIRDLSKEDSGVYTCVASSKNGKYVWSAILRVDSPTNPSINFFRGPDPSSLPGAPGRPLVKNFTDSSITISWSQNNKIGSSSLLGYQVEMFGGGLDAWAVVARRLQQPIYTQRQLQPATQCVFLVRAENSHGLSPPSPLSETIIIGGDSTDLLMSNEDGAGTALIAEARASLQADEVVQILEVMPVESTMVKVAWETINSFNVEGFYIYYRPLDSPNITIGEYSMQTVLHSGSVSGFSIAGLRKYTTYEFFLIPFYKNIDGRPSNSKIARTLEDAPSEPPLQLEAFLLNSSFVYLKWKPPPLGTHNGVIQYYRVVVKEANNESRVVHNVSVSVIDDGGISGVALGGLLPSAAYWLQLAAATNAGEGPYTPAAALRLPIDMDPASKLLNHPHSRDMGQNPQQIEPGDLLSETWFLALLGSMLTVMTLLFIITFLVRRHHLLTKKSALPNLYDSRSTGTSLVTQLNMKSTVPHALTSSYNQNSITKTDSLLWMDNRPGSWRQSIKEIHGLSDYSQVNEPGLLPEYDKINPQGMPDYAEVDASMITYRKSSLDDSGNSPSAYASVTVVGSCKQNTGSRGWIQMCTGSQSKVNEEIEEEVYPANNGGYYNRNVYSDTYFSSDRSNIFQFSDVPQVSETQNPMQSNLGTTNFAPSRTTKERTYSLPQTPCSTIRRSHRLQMIRSQNMDKLKISNDPHKERMNMDVANGYHEIRTQENPTFGLVDNPDSRNANMIDDPGHDKHFYNHVQPMKLINHHYSRPSVTRPSPTSKVNVLSSFSTMKSPTAKCKIDYHSTTRSEPGNQ